MKNTYIGIDLGTSAAKLLLVDEDGSILNSVTKEYPLEFPQPGWSQQDPEDWKRAVFSGIPELLRDHGNILLAFAAHFRLQAPGDSWQSLPECSDCNMLFPRKFPSCNFFKGRV